MVDRSPREGEGFWRPAAMPAQGAVVRARPTAMQHSPRWCDQGNNIIHVAYLGRTRTIITRTRASITGAVPKARDAAGRDLVV
jgi:hypothetical protein